MHAAGARLICWCAVWLYVEVVSKPLSGWQWCYIGHLRLLSTYVWTARLSAIFIQALCPSWKPHWLATWHVQTFVVGPSAVENVIYWWCQVMLHQHHKNDSRRQRRSPSQERVSDFTKLEAHEPTARPQHTICFWQHLDDTTNQQHWRQQQTCMNIHHHQLPTAASTQHTTAHNRHISVVGWLVGWLGFNGAFNTI